MADRRLFLKSLFGASVAYAFMPSVPIIGEEKSELLPVEPQFYCYVQIWRVPFGFNGRDLVASTDPADQILMYQPQASPLIELVRQMQMKGTGLRKYDWYKAPEYLIERPKYHAIIKDLKV